MRLVVAIGLPAWLLAAGTVSGQSPVQEFLATEIGQVPPVVMYRSAYSFERDTDQPGRTMEWLDYDLRALVPVKQSPSDDLSLMTRLRAMDIHTDVRIPGTADAFPDHLWNLNIGPVYRRKLDNGWQVGGNFLIGSPSDKPFASLDEYSFSGNLFLRIPDTGRNAWILFVNYANDREYCRHIPLPGAGYWFEPNKKLQALLGAPVASVRYDPIEQVRLEASYIAVRNIEAQVTYMPRPWLRFYTGFRWGNDRFFRRDRRDDEDMLFLYEKQVRGGVIVPITKFAVLDISGGFAFDRFWFEGEDYNDRGQHRIDVSDGPFIAARIIMRF